LIHQPVAQFVGGEFAPPESAIVFWVGCVLWATVPETSVHKQCEPRLPENKIRFTENFLIPPPAGNAMSPKKFYRS
jgi:hypothetical protein